MVDPIKKRKMLRYRWIMFILLLVAYFFVYFHRNSTSVIGDDIVNTFGGSVALLGSVYFYSYLMMQLPSGILSDNFGPRRSTFIFLLVATCGVFMTCFGNGIWTMYLGKALIGIGLAVVYLPLMRIIAVWFRKNEFATLAGVVIAVGNVGALGATAPLEYMIDMMSWQSVYTILGVVTLILAFLCLILIRDHPSKMGYPSIEEIEYEETGIEPQDNVAEKIPITHALKQIFTSGRKFWMPALAYFMIYGAIMVYQGLWGKIYFQTVYLFPNAVWMLTAVAIGKIFSSAALGFIADRFGLSKRTIMVVGNIGFLAMWGLLWIFTGEIDSFLFWICVNFMFGFFGGFMTVSFGLVKSQFPTSISATAVAALNIFLFSGAAVMQSLSHFIIVNRTSAEFELLWMIMFVCVIAAVILSALSVEKKKVVVERV